MESSSYGDSLLINADPSTTKEQELRQIIKRLQARILELEAQLDNAPKWTATSGHQNLMPSYDGWAPSSMVNEVVPEKSGQIGWPSTSCLPLIPMTSTHDDHGAMENATMYSATSRANDTLATTVPIVTSPCMPEMYALDYQQTPICAYEPFAASRMSQYTGALSVQSAVGSRFNPYIDPAYDDPGSSNSSTRPTDMRNVGHILPRSLQTTGIPDLRMPRVHILDCSILPLRIVLPSISHDANMEGLMSHAWNFYSRLKEKARRGVHLDMRTILGRETLELGAFFSVSNASHRTASPHNVSMWAASLTRHASLSIPDQVALAYMNSLIMRVSRVNIAVSPLPLSFSSFCLSPSRRSKN